MAASPKVNVSTRVLLVDDDEAICGLVSKYLQHHGHSVEVIHDGREMDRMLQSPFDVVLLDMGLPGVDGLALLDRLAREHKELAVVMMTAAVGVDNIVDAMRRGAFDYLTKPLDLQRLAIVVRNAAEHTRLRLESDGLRAAMIRGDGGPHLICGSQAMTEVISLVERVAASKVPVLIYGEPGTGKELVAHRIHARSRRRDAPFVVVNCALKPAEMLEQQLFGSSANGQRGRFEEARGGTLFLDEVGELSTDLQARLHRTMHEASLQDRRNGQQQNDNDVRVVAATVRHLPSEVSRGTFRADLFYRLNVFSITVPPLRDRRDDIAALARYALARFAARENQPPPSLPDEVLEVLLRYDWPGNVRELFNTMERMALTASGGIIRPGDLPEDIRESSAARAEDRSLLPGLDDSQQSVRPLHEVEREMMIAALRETEGNVSEAARRLGIGRATFYRRAQRHGLTREDGFPG